MEKAFTFLIFAILWFLRLIFLSGKTGKKIHNKIYLSVGAIFGNKLVHIRKWQMLKISSNNTDSAFVRWQEIIYRSRYWRFALKNIFIKRFLIERIKRKLLYKNFYIPELVSISPTTKCNLDCEYCFANNQSITTMSESLLRKIIQEQSDLGVNFVSIIGGEPFLCDYDLIKIMECYPETVFHIASNGTLLNKHSIKRMAKLQNVILLLAIDGDKNITDAIRGVGVFDQVMEIAKICQKEQMLFSFSVMINRNNFYFLEDCGFLSMLENTGCIAVSFSTYVPVGKNKRIDWQLTKSQEERLKIINENLINEYPFFVILGKNGSRDVTNCQAARRYVHFLPTGQAEVCPFCQVKDEGLNASNNSLLEIFNSEYFNRVRSLTNEGIPGFVPCKYTENKIVKNFLEKTLLNQKKETGNVTNQKGIIRYV